MPRQYKLAIELTYQERLFLQRRLQAPTKYAALRADIILRASRGQSSYAIAKELKVSKNTVRNWRSRFELLRLKGLETRPIPGRPQKDRQPIGGLASPG